jgi:diaminopimelate decarboxylase
MQVTAQAIPRMGPNTDPASVPLVEWNEGYLVVRDDLFPGGTKARFMPALFEGADEVVYASPAEGGAQTALAHTARALGKRATIFVAGRAKLHERTLEAARVGAKIVQVRPGYLSVVQARARQYCDERGARLVPFGVDLPEAISRIAAAARSTGLEPDEVWCAAGSGVLARGLAKAWPKAKRHVVQVGRELEPWQVAHATIHTHWLKFGVKTNTRPPFPSDPHYDAKAWEQMRMMTRWIEPGRVLFWNVTGPAKP